MPRRKTPFTSDTKYRAGTKWLIARDALLLVVFAVALLALAIRLTRGRFR
ncbi:MAG: hypothetical protein ACKOTF_05750 [Opitutaceae bacterium]